MSDLTIKPAATKRNRKPNLATLESAPAEANQSLAKVEPTQISLTPQTLSSSSMVTPESLSTGSDNAALGLMATSALREAFDLAQSFQDYSTALGKADQIRGAVIARFNADVDGRAVRVAQSELDLKALLAMAETANNVKNDRIAKMKEETQAAEAEVNALMDELGISL